MKLLKARVNNLETNLHIEIDMERLEDSSKALSFIGIEVSDALKLIPTPEEKVEVIAKEEEQKRLFKKLKLKQRKRKRLKIIFLQLKKKKQKKFKMKLFKNKLIIMKQKQHLMQNHHSGKDLKIVKLLEL